MLVDARRRHLLGGALAAAALPLVSGCSEELDPNRLVIGGLPVTCNLTLPIACTAKGVVNARNGGKGIQFKYQKYSGWPEVKESLMAGRIQAAYMLAPLVMDLADSGIKMKIVSLGHRSGAVIMVRTDSPYRSFADLRGKRIAIPSRFAVDYLFLGKMLARVGMTRKDVEIYEMAPPDMPSALYANAIDAYCTGEPFGASAERKGFARPLALTRDEWPNYICCVLTVREDLINAQRPMVQELVDYIQAAGNWLDASHANRLQGAALAAQRTFFNQDPNILRYVMEHPADRVTYGDLRMIREEFDDLMQLAVRSGTLKRPVPFESYVDPSFVKAVRPVPIALA
ncbi:MAG: ABC transporter substrate-binding protein [Telluria sp.]